MNLHRNIITILIGLLVGAVPCTAETWTLLPGESFTFNNVTVTWSMPARPDTESTKNGCLDFKGPNRSLTGLPPAETNMVYLDETVFGISFHFKESGPENQSLSVMEISADTQPDSFTQGSKPEHFKFYVSNINPVRLNDWKIRISDQRAQYPDGTNRYQVIASRQKDREEVVLPALDGAQKQAGRFQFRIVDFDAASRTARLDVEADADRSIRGRDAYIGGLRFDQSESYEEVVNRLAKEYDFQVEWLEYPGHPESVQDLKDAYRTSSGSYSGQTVDEALSLYNSRTTWPQTNLREIAELVWKTPTLLQIRPRNYDQVVAEKEKEFQRELKNQEVETQFDKEYSIQIKIYPLKGISLTAAKALIEPELASYYIVFSRHSRPDRTSYRTYLIAAEDELEQLEQTEGKLYKLKSVQERVLVDEESNSLIVTAIASTQQRIENLLGRATEMLGAQRGTDAEIRKREIEIILLQGTKAEDGRIPLRFREGGTIGKIPVKPGSIVQEGALIAELDLHDLNFRFDQLRIDLDRQETEVAAAKEKLQQTQQLFGTGRVPKSDLTEAALQFKRAESERAQTQIEVQKVETALAHSTLEAPVAGTIQSILAKVGEPVTPAQVVAWFVPAGKQAQPNPASPAPDPEMEARYGITAEDLKLFGFNQVTELGKAIVTLTADPGEAGNALVSLSKEYRCELSYQDRRDPYVIIKGRLIASDSDKAILENTLYLEKDKPTLLGLTNLEDALILVIRLHS